MRIKKYIITLLCFVVFLKISSCQNIGYQVKLAENETDAYQAQFNIIGAPANGVDIVLNNGDVLTVTSDGSYSFTNSFNIGDTYSISVPTQPELQPGSLYRPNCTVINPMVTITEQNIHTPLVVCSENIEVTQDLVHGLADGSDIENTAPNCHWIKLAYPESVDGIYWIDPDGELGVTSPFRAFCDMTTDGGGWLLFNKSMFTAVGPTKIEMTGDASLAEPTDPWSGGNIVCDFTDSALCGVTPSKFIEASLAPDYYAPGFYTSSLINASDDLMTSAPDELYAMMHRGIVDQLRTVSYAQNRLRSVIVQRQGSISTYVQSSKRFNPIQHKCTNNAGVCNGSDQSGCANDFILNDEVYYSYNSNTHQSSSSYPLVEWTFPCSASDGISTVNLLPAAWMAGSSDSLDPMATPSTFYDLTGANVNSSGPVSHNALLTNFAAGCTDVNDCPYTTVWVK